jgi:hypothetical protein
MVLFAYCPKRLGITTGLLALSALPRVAAPPPARRLAALGREEYNSAYRVATKGAEHSSPNATTAALGWSFAAPKPLARCNSAGMAGSPSAGVAVGAGLM